LKISFDSILLDDTIEKKLQFDIVKKLVQVLKRIGEKNVIFA